LIYKIKEEKMAYQVNRDARAGNGPADDTLLAIKNTQGGQFYGLSATNGDAAVRYLQVFNKAAADVTLGSDTPYIVIPMASSADINVNYLGGVFMQDGISVACTTTRDGNTGATVAAEVNVVYQ